MPRRLTNIQLISTAGIAPEDLAHCLECACPGSEHSEGCTGIATLVAIPMQRGERQLAAISWLQYASL